MLMRHYVRFLRLQIWASDRHNDPDSLFSRPSSRCLPSPLFCAISVRSGRRRGTDYSDDIHVPPLIRVDALKLVWTSRLPPPVAFTPYLTAKPCNKAPE